MIGLQTRVNHEYLSKVAPASPACDNAFSSRLLEIPADIVVANEIGGKLTALLAYSKLEGFVDFHNGNIVRWPFDAIMEVEFIICKELMDLIYHLHGMNLLKTSEEINKFMSL